MKKRRWIVIGIICLILLILIIIIALNFSDFQLYFRDCHEVSTAGTGGMSFARIDKNYDCSIIVSNHNPFNPIKRFPMEVGEQCYSIDSDHANCEGGEQINTTLNGRKLQLVCCPSPCATGKSPNSWTTLNCTRWDDYLIDP